MLEHRNAERRKAGNRRVRTDPRYKEPEKDRRRQHERRRGERRKNLTASVTCRKCGALFIITKDIFYKTVHEGKPILCPKGCTKDNTKIAKTALFMIERGKRK